MAKRRAHRKSHKGGITLTRFEIPAQDHEEFKAAVLEGAGKRVEAGKRALNDLLALFHKCDPLQILASDSASPWTRPALDFAISNPRFDERAQAWRGACR